MVTKAQQHRQQQLRELSAAPSLGTEIALVAMIGLFLWAVPDLAVWISSWSGASACR